MQTINAFRQLVQTKMAEGTGVAFVGGLLEGPNGGEEWLGSVYVERIQEDPGRPAEQQVFLLIRMWAPYDMAAAEMPDRPFDPQPLEAMAEKLLATIAKNQKGLGDAWFQRILSMDFDPVKQGLQARMMAYSDNPGVGAETVAVP